MNRDSFQFQVLVMHLLHHVPFYIRKYGPVRAYWMFKFERFNSFLNRIMTQERHREANLIEAYKVSDISII